MNSSSSSVPFLTIENSGRKRSRTPNQNHSMTKEVSVETPGREIISFPNLLEACEEEKKENNDKSEIENIRVLIGASSTAIDNTVHIKETNDIHISNMELTKFPNFPNFSNTEISPCVFKEDRDLDDQKDTSFLTQETVSESDSDSDREGIDDLRNSSFLTQDTVAESNSDSDREEVGSCICVTQSYDADSCIGITYTSEEENSSYYTSASSSVYSKQSIGVHFADEVGLPIQRLCLYECDRKQREYAELTVLCICPEKKTFEFLHVGYHMNEECPTSVNDLLKGLPDMCTNQTFVDARFVALYRSNKTGTNFENLCSPSQPSGPATKGATSNNDSDKYSCSLLLRDCNFREKEVVVAAIHGSTERAVLAGIGPLLSNQKILKTLKRARRSRRGLKFISRHRCGGDEDKDGLYHRQKCHNLSLRRKRKAKKEKKMTDEKHPNAAPKMDVDFGELVDEYCDDYDPLRDIAEYHTKLLLGILAVSSGTVVFSALGF